MPTDQARGGERHLQICGVQLIHDRPQRNPRVGQVSHGAEVRPLRHETQQQMVRRHVLPGGADEAESIRHPRHQSGGVHPKDQCPRILP
jgi:hypothetical protein